MKFKNKFNVLLLLLLCTGIQLFAQKSLVVIEGIVKSDSTLLENINVLNRTQQLGSSSNAKGEFSLHAKLGDSILFSSINYTNRVIQISEKHISEKKLIVYLEQDFNQLEEVVLDQKVNLGFGKIDVQKGMILNTTEDSKKKGPDLRRMTDPTYGNVGVNFVSILSLLTKNLRSKNKAKKAEKLENQRLLEEFPTKLYNLYKADFFIDELNIPDHKIYLFLEYCQDNGLSNHLKSNEFQIKNFLIVQSRKFNKRTE